MRLILITICLSITFLANGQESPVDRLFNKYSDQDGFTTVYISEYMLNLFQSKKIVKDETDKAMSKLESIRILTLDDKSLYKDVNFFTEVMKELPIKEYKELMVIREKDQQIKMLILEKNERIYEFLMIGGGDDNFLISIIGDMDIETLSEISHDMDLGLPENFDELY